MCAGPAIGLDLESLLRAGLPPWKISLQIIASLCEILDIADEDHEVHGDLSPRFAFIDDTGAVSLEGFGVARAKTSAPEGQPRGAPTDLYGLGIIAYRLLCTLPLPTFSIEDPDVHDDAVIDAILQIDISGVNDEIQGDIQWFLAKLLSFDREDRPTPVEVWRSFIAFADAVPGPDLAPWCALAVEGKGERRTEQKAGPSVAPEAGPSEEDLGGPVKQSGPLAAGAIAFGDSAAKGQATAFWSRDAMKAALERADDEEKTYRPPAGGSTEFWSKDQRQAMAAGTAEAPRPKRSTADSRSGGLAAPDSARPAPPPAKLPPEPVPSTGTAGASALDAPSRAPPPSPAAPPSSQATLPPGPVAPASAPVKPISGPVAVQTARVEPPRAVSSTSLPPEAPPASRTGLYLVIGAVLLVVVLGVACAGLGGLGGAFALWQSSTETTVTAPTPLSPNPAPTAAPGPANPAPVAAPAPGPSPSPGSVPSPKPGVAPSPSPQPRPTPSPSPRPSPSPSPRPGPSPAPSPRPSPSPAPAPAPSTSPSVRPKPPPAPPDPGSPVAIAFKSGGRGSVVCSGARTSFDGPTTINLEGYQLPVSCLVTIDGSRGVFQVYTSGVVTCDKSGTDVVCVPARVQ
jgi:hypothetical protein